MAVDSTEELVTAWVQGHLEPPASCVMFTERALHLAPGVLCAVLGFVPLGEARPMSVQEAIMASTEIDNDLKPMLLAPALELIKQSRHHARLWSVPPPRSS